MASEINHIFEGRALYRSRQWVWLHSQGSLVRAPVLPHTGNTCNFRLISHEIIYTVILRFPLIQEGQFLVISEFMCTLNHFVLVNCLEGLSLSARRSGRVVHLIASLGIIDRDSANQIYCYMSGIVVTLSRSVVLRRCSLLNSHKPTHSHSYSAISNGMKSYNLPSRDEFWLVSSGGWNAAFRGCI